MVQSMPAQLLRRDEEVPSRSSRMDVIDSENDPSIGNLSIEAIKIGEEDEDSKMILSEENNVQENQQCPLQEVQNNTAMNNSSPAHGVSSSTEKISLSLERCKDPSDFFDPNETNRPTIKRHARHTCVFRHSPHNHSPEDCHLWTLNQVDTVSLGSNANDENDNDGTMSIEPELDDEDNVMYLEVGTEHSGVLASPTAYFLGVMNGLPVLHEENEEETTNRNVPKCENAEKSESTFDSFQPIIEVRKELLPVVREGDYEEDIVASPTGGTSRRATKEKEELRNEESMSMFPFDEEDY
ncbi:expressed unknown protein [Seminavis robusta]|uniref:Uncharacterized protein n=1 Tax=Seminavis robusta TaxID=568900 RepID=A0A9N8DXD5_9STRA|nr:expressed unknown protein [Seminavis robusta]|eukprot:Sro448_g145100.1 n/a (297) ;mRNA; r:21355-22245